MKNLFLKKPFTALLLAMPFLLASMSAEAKVRLPSVLGHNMVLQQQTDVKLWGKAKENSPVTVKTSWNNGKYETTADGEGRWLLI